MPSTITCHYKRSISLPDYTLGFRVMPVLFVHFTTVVNVGPVKYLKVTTCQDIREEDVMDTYYIMKQSIALQFNGLFV